MEHTFLNFHHLIFDPERLPIALAALLLTIIAGMVTGPRMGNAGPFFRGVLDALFGAFGSRLDRRQRPVADLMFRGFFLTLFVLALCYALGMGAAIGIKAHPLYGLPEILCLSLLMTSGTVWYALLQLYFAMRDKQSIKGAYYTISRTTRVDLSGADDFAITRAGMGLAARMFDKGLVAPVVWYLIAGLPGAFIYSGLSALAWRFGKDGFTKGFGRIPLELEKIMGFAPTMLAGLLIALAGLFTPTAGMTRALIGMMQSKGAAKYEEGGLPLTAMARALKVSLGGPAVDLDGSALQRQWVGPPDATAKLEKGHLRRAMYISLMAHLLFAAALGGAMLYGGGLF